MASMSDRRAFIMDSQLSANSKAGYNCSLVYFKNWLCKNEPSYVVNDEICGAQLTQEVVESFLTSQIYRVGEDGKTNTGVGISRLKTYRSAIRFLLQKQKVPDFEKFIESLKQFYSGLKRVDAQRRRNGETMAAVTEGKEALPFEVYCTLENRLLGSTKNERYLWAHCYASLSWNLMCRCNNTADIHLDKMCWRNDSLGIYFTVTKTDQGGKK